MWEFVYIHAYMCVFVQFKVEDKHKKDSIFDYDKNVPDIPSKAWNDVIKYIK